MQKDSGRVSVQRKHTQKTSERCSDVVHLTVLTVSAIVLQMPHVQKIKAYGLLQFAETTGKPSPNCICSCLFVMHVKFNHIIF